MKLKAVAAFAAFAGIVAMGALLAPGASAGKAHRGSTVNNVVVTVAGTGTGTGTVTSNPSGISCPGTCMATFPSGNAVVLTATPMAGSVVAGFTGCDTSTATTCTVTPTSSPRQVAVTFNLATPTDADGDGVPDASDQCPSLPGPADNNGCPKYEPPAPVPPGNADCVKAKTQLDHAKGKLRALKHFGNSSDKKIQQAKDRVKKAKKRVKKVCGK